jgi:hypothetical protein
MHAPRRLVSLIGRSVTSPLVHAAVVCRCPTPEPRLARQTGEERYPILKEIAETISGPAAREAYAAQENER